MINIKWFPPMPHCRVYADSPLHQGLIIALDRQLLSLEIETDNAILKGHDTYNSLVSNCRWFMHKGKTMFLCHNFRQGNKVAHVLATAALKHPSSNQVYHFVTPPYDDVLNSLAQDRSSTSGVDGAAGLGKLGNLALVLTGYVAPGVLDHQRLAHPASDVDDFTSAWYFIRSFGPEDDEDRVSPIHAESTSSDIIGNQQVGEIAKNEERNEDYVRNAEISTDNDSSVSRTENEGVCEKPIEQGARDAAESSKSSSDDSYSLISKTSSKSPSGESYSVISEISSKSQSDESHTSILRSVHSVSPNGSPSKNSWQKVDFLGSGSFGTVYEGFTDDGFFFSVKEVSLIDPGDQQSLYQLEQDISLLSRIEM
ncbi:hypothetical protein K7X08_036669 [Anisodus acutangulus]|uniref:Protein kinase domain-containing protein n=1 Tax=Anisodus acutangulus TaxID=402998 RepID=A0A9Q1L6R5_9SOLA|nr:hypothetical protein K7X08_036669 [Anisodus acutangulus]